MNTSGIAWVAFLRVFAESSGGFWGWMADKPVHCVGMTILGHWNFDADDPDLTSPGF
jgi:hypothetical protein